MRVENRRKSRLRWSVSPTVSLPLLCVLLFVGGQVRAEDDVARLEARIEALEEQIRTLRDELEKIRQAGRDRSVAPELEKPPAAAAEVGERGAALRSGDGSLVVRLRGYFQADSRVYLTEDSFAGNDSFLMRRVRPVLELTAFRDFEFRVMPDFGGSSASLFDAYFNWRIAPVLQVRAGKMKSPTALERLQSATALGFVERGLPTHLLPNRDVGVQIHGGFGRRLDYTVGLFNGTRDGGSSVTDGDDGKDLAVRVFAHPFRDRDDSPVKGLGIGIATTYGRHEGTPRGYATTGQQDFFRFRTGVVNDGLIRRVSPQGYFYSGPAGVLWEWAQSSQELRLGGSRLTVRSRAWQILGSYMITGEDASFGAVRPHRNLGRGDGGWGALEVVARVGRLTVDESAFPILADPEAYAFQANGLGVGLNWYPNQFVKYTLDLGRTAFDNVPGGARKRPENTLFSRVQFAF